MHIFLQMTFIKTNIFFLLYILHLALRLQQTSPGGSLLRDGGLRMCRPAPFLPPQQTAQKPPSLCPAQGPRAAGELT